MKTDQYTRTVLTVIALCLVWIAVNGVPSVDVQAQGGNFQISSTQYGVFRVEAETGDITYFRGDFTTPDRPGGIRWTMHTVR